MILLPRAVKVYFAVKPTNLRKSFDGLSNDVRQVVWKRRGLQRKDGPLKNVDLLQALD